MNNLEEIYQVKRKLLSQLVNDEDIVRMIDENYIDNADDLIYKNIFDTLYIPTTVDEVKTYVCFDIFCPNIQDDLYGDLVLHFYIFEHQDRSKFVSGNKKYSRVDLLQSKISEKLNGKTFLGDGYSLDTIHLKSSTPLLIDKVHRGKELILYSTGIVKANCDI